MFSSTVQFVHRNKISLVLSAFCLFVIYRIGVHERTMQIVRQSKPAILPSQENRRRNQYRRKMENIQDRHQQKRSDLNKLDAKPARVHNKFFEQVFGSLKGKGNVSEIIGNPFRVKIFPFDNFPKSFSGSPSSVWERINEFKLDIALTKPNQKLEEYPSCMAVCKGFVQRNTQTKLEFSGDPNGNKCTESFPYVHVGDNQNPERGQRRAETTTPCFLRVERSHLRGAGRGVITKIDIPAGLIFGPYEGNVVEDEEKAMRAGYAWAVLDDYEDNKILHFIDAQNPNISNWARYVDAARFQEEQNVYGFSYDSKIWYLVYKDIDKNGELLTWYGPEYSKTLGYFVTVPTDTIEPGIAPSRKHVRCPKCDTFGSDFYEDKNGKHLNPNTNEKATKQS